MANGWLSHTLSDNVRRETTLAMVKESTRLAGSYVKMGRISLRVHSELRAALEFLAKQDRRKLSTYIECVLIDHAAAILTNPFRSDGSLDRRSGPREFRLRTPGRHRR
jgi:hypothetical protein